MASATTVLTSNDSAILSAIFDPESSPSAAVSISISIPAIRDIPSSLLPFLQSRELKAVKSLNTPSPSAASIEAAIQDLSSLLQDYPTYSPAYLNRAQAVRLQLDSNDASRIAFFSAANLPQTSLLFSDLTTVITLATPETPSSPISSLESDLLSKAHTHRGYLLLKAASVKKAKRDVGALPNKLEGMDTEELEEMASRDFFLGGRYGNKIARQLSVQTNPYAKMCGAIVKEAMRKEREEFEKCNIVQD